MNYLFNADRVFILRTTAIYLCKRPAVRRWQLCQSKSFLPLMFAVIHMFRRELATGGGGSSIVKVPGDVPPARVCFFKPSSLAKGILFANFSPLSLAKGILFANFSPFSLAKGILFANFRPFSLGKGILFGNFGQRNVKLR